MAQGPILIFDKSSLESLNLDEAVLLDNFYISNITPLFFVECLADLEKAIKSRSTPEQVVAHLRACDVAIEEGPVAKQGARGVLRSVYCRDPDGSLIEISSYEGEAA